MLTFESRSVVAMVVVVPVLISRSNRGIALGGLQQLRLIHHAIKSKQSKLFR